MMKLPVIVIALLGLLVAAYVVAQYIWVMAPQ
jgi:hypothetical protein